MIAAAQPVEPLAIKTSTEGPAINRPGFTKNEVNFYRGRLDRDILSAAFGGILFRLKGVAYSPEGEVAAPVASPISG